MNYKNMRVGIPMLISIVCLLAAFAFAQDRPSNDSSPPPRTRSEKLLSAAAPKTVATLENHQRCICIDDEDSAAVEKIKLALHGPLSAPGLDYTDTPLHEVMKDLQQRFAIPIRIDRAALDEVGVNADSPITMNLHGISLQAALRLILKPLSLTYLLENEVLLITTSDRADKELLTCVYDIRDLGFTATAAAAKSSLPPPDNNRLADVITNCIAKDTWSKNGGSQAEIQPLGPDLLVISQTHAVHEKIQHFLDAIRRVKSEE